MDEKEVIELKKNLTLIFQSILDYINEKRFSLTGLQNNLTLEKEKIYDGNSIDFDLFDDNKKFYAHFFKFYISGRHTEINLLDLLNDRFEKENLVIFLEYLIKILEIYPDSYKSSAFKINLSILFAYLRKKNVKDTVESKDYFYLSIKELQNEFPNEEIKEKISLIWENEYKKYKKIFLEEINGMMLPESLKDNHELVKQKYSLSESFNNDEIKADNIQTYIKNNDKLITAQINSLIKSIALDESYSNTFKNIFFKLTDSDEIVNLIMVTKEIGSEILEIMIYYNLRNNKDIKNMMNDMTGELDNIAKSDVFYEKLKNVLNSRVIKNYYKYKRKFSGLYDTVITDMDDCDVNLLGAYDEFMKKYCEDKNWFFNLIRYKYLPSGKRAFVNENLKIFLNPLYIQVAKIIDMNKEDDINGLKKILTSYLIIIFIHEIIHLLKFMKAKEEGLKYDDLSKLPSTPQQKDGGEVFINYLFRKPIINEITLVQSEKLLDINNWNDINKLYEIFEKNNVNENNISAMSIKFYLTSNQKKKNGWFNMN